MVAVQLADAFELGRIVFTLAAVLAVGRTGGWAARRLRQPAVIGEIAAGVLLGPSLVGSSWPDLTAVFFDERASDHLRPLAQLGLVVFVFSTGISLDVAELRRVGRRAVAISSASVFVPSILGFVLALWMYPRFGGSVSGAGFCLFVAAAMAVTALPVLARILKDTGLVGSRLGVLVIGCAVVDDVTAWCLLAVVSAVVGATGPGGALLTVVFTATFAFALLLIVRPALDRASRVPAWAAILLALSCAGATDAIGSHAVFGAFMAGLIVPKAKVSQVSIERFLFPVLLPVFFVLAGLSTRFDMLSSPYLLGVALLVIVVASLGKFGGSLVAARLSGEPWREAAAIGVLLNARGVTELVLLSVGRELGVVSPMVFSMFVLMTLVTTAATTPALRRVLDQPLSLDRCEVKSTRGGEGMSVRVHHIAISIEDPQNSKPFYDALFAALGGKDGIASERLCSWSAGSVELLAYVAEVPGSPHVFGSTGWQHVAIEVDSRDIVDAVASVAKAQARVVHEAREYPEYWDGYYAVFFEDPDNVRWEVMFPAGHE